MSSDAPRAKTHWPTFRKYLPDCCQIALERDHFRTRGLAAAAALGHCSQPLVGEWAPGGRAVPNVRLLATSQCPASNPPPPPPPPTHTAPTSPPFSLTEPLSWQDLNLKLRLYDFHRYSSSTSLVFFRSFHLVPPFLPCSSLEHQNAFPAQFASD